MPKHSKERLNDYLRSEASRNYDHRGYALEHRAYKKGGELIIELIEDILIEKPKPYAYLSIGIPQFKIKGAFMSITKKRSELKDAGDGVKFITGTLTPETTEGQIEKVKDGSVVASSDNEAAAVSLETDDQLKWKAVVDATKIPFKAKFSFNGNADLVDGGSVDNITGEVEVDFIEDEASQLVVGVD